VAFGTIVGLNIEGIVF